MVDRVAPLPPTGRGNGSNGNRTNGNGSGNGSRALTGPGPAKARHPWRFAIVAVGLLIVVNLLVYVGVSADTSDKTRVLPSEVQNVLPAPGSQVRVQDTVAVDLRDDLTGVLVIDGVELPENEISRIPSLGEISFRPGQGKVFERLEPGVHNVSVIYWPQIKNRSDGTQTFTWSFSTG
ncbi:MAG TPA: hypothetical protein VIB48_13290 [Acidimicrobiia bacterium]